MEKSNPTDTVDQHFQVLTPLMDWCAVLSQNLRQLRNVGNDPAAISSRTENATATLRAV
jgi:hypothetical protein